jgi:hypothetical protein
MSTQKRFLSIPVIGAMAMIVIALLVEGNLGQPCATKCRQIRGLMSATWLLAIVISVAQLVFSLNPPAFPILTSDTSLLALSSQTTHISPQSAPNLPSFPQRDLVQWKTLQAQADGVLLSASVTRAK